MVPAGALPGISVFGLGYVGSISAACFASRGHRVVGVDVDPRKLDLLRRGMAPVIEAGLGELVRDAVASGRLSVTDSATGAVLRQRRVPGLRGHALAAGRWPLDRLPGGGDRRRSAPPSRPRTAGTRSSTAARCCRGRARAC